MAATSMPQATSPRSTSCAPAARAMDAAIAACAVQCVIEPPPPRIGGDCFCLYVPAGSSKVVALNGSGRAPAPPRRSTARRRPHRLGQHLAHPDGARAISAWELLNRTHGRLGLDRILQAAIAYAEEGFPLSPRVAWDWASGVGKLSRHPASARRFLVDGEAPGLGTRFRQPELARTFRAIAAKGKRAFYEGEVAADIVATLRAAGGCTPRRISPAAPTSPNSSRPISIGWRGMEVFQCPPNGVGMHVLQILGTLGNLETPEGGPGSALRFHRHIEAARFAYRDRDAFLADPSQADVPVAKLLDAGYLKRIAAAIRDNAAMTEAELPPPGESDLAKHKDTIYLCVVDRDGNACSFINSLFEGFGSGILAEKSGVMLQNRGFGFRIQEGTPTASRRTSARCTPSSPAW